MFVTHEICEVFRVGLRAVSLVAQQPLGLMITVWWGFLRKNKRRNRSGDNVRQWYDKKKARMYASVGGEEAGGYPLKIMP